MANPLHTRPRDHQNCEVAGVKSVCNFSAVECLECSLGLVGFVVYQALKILVPPRTTVSDVRD
eukprot:6433563-Amphidinium_carterae.1